MTVYVSSVLQIQNVAYIVSPSGGSYPCTGGFITFQATYTPPNTAVILMARQLTLTQTVALPVEGELPSATLETVFDRATMQIQQIATAQSLSLQLPITSIGVSTALPAPVAFDLFGWDSTATSIVNYSPAQIVASVPGMGSGNVIGPNSSTVGHVAAFANTNGQLLEDTGIPFSDIYSTLNPPPAGLTPLFGTANPNGTITGVLGQTYYDTSNVVEYVCTTAGNSHWLRLSLPIGTIAYIASGSSVPAGWIICNGVTQSGVTPPNYIGMFIQGCNLTGVTGNGNSNGYDTSGTATPGTAVGATANNLTHGHSFSGNVGSQTSITVNAGSSAPAAQVNTGSVSGSTGSSLGNVSTQPAALTAIPIYKL